MGLLRTGVNGQSFCEHGVLDVFRGQLLCVAGAVSDPQVADEGAEGRAGDPTREPVSGLAQPPARDAPASLGSGSAVLRNWQGGNRKTKRRKSGGAQTGPRLLATRGFMSPSPCAAQPVLPGSRDP